MVVLDRQFTTHGCVVEFFYGCNPIWLPITNKSVVPVTRPTYLSQYKSKGTQLVRSSVFLTKSIFLAI